MDAVAYASGGRCLSGTADLGARRGRSYRQIMSLLQTTAPTILRWKQRFERAGIDGLDPVHKGSEPRASPMRLCKPAALGVSKSTVQRVWAQLRLKPHRLDRYMASNDPQFKQKAADIIGRYLRPPQHAAVFSRG